MTTQNDIVEAGAHLEQVRQILAAIGMTILAIAPEVAVHCSEGQASALMEAAKDTLRPVMECIDAQLDELRVRYEATSAEVESLESLLVDP